MYKEILRKLLLSNIALITLLELNGCSSDKNYVRNRYTTKEECLKDYSKEQCEQQTENRIDTHSTYMPYYYGPWYHYGYMGTLESGRTSVGTGYSTVASHVVNSEGAAIGRSGFSGMKAGSFARGGFGATGKGFSVGT